MSGSSLRIGETAKEQMRQSPCMLGKYTQMHIM